MGGVGMTDAETRLAHEGAVMAAILRKQTPYGNSMGLDVWHVDKALQRMRRRGEVRYDRRAAAWVVGAKPAKAKRAATQPLLYEAPAKRTASEAGAPAKTKRGSKQTTGDVMAIEGAARVANAIAAASGQAKRGGA